MGFYVYFYMAMYLSFVYEFKDKIKEIFLTTLNNSLVFIVVKKCVLTSIFILSFYIAIVFRSQFISISHILIFSFTQCLQEGCFLMSLFVTYGISLSVVWSAKHNEIYVIEGLCASMG